MDTTSNLNEITGIVTDIEADLLALTVRNAQTARAVRRKYTKMLKHVSPELMLQLARKIIDQGRYHWFAYELVRYHQPTFDRLSEDELEELGKGINNWGRVDTFARILAGPAWLKGQVSDQLVFKWVRSPDLWWRRAALVSTVALNMRSQGGKGDTTRTLKVCQMLVNDREDMVIKALSWALRELVVHDVRAVEAFLSKHEGILAARVKREVKHKIKTGLKYPRRNTPKK